jgi:hypothetical protein
LSDILYKRICKLVGMNYAISEEEVWSIYEKCGSIDKTIESIKNGATTEDYK